MLVLRKAHCPTRVCIPEGYKALTRLVLGCPSFSSETSKPGQLVVHLQPSALLNRCGCPLVPTRHFSRVSHFASTGRFRKAGLRDKTPRDHPPVCVVAGRPRSRRRCKGFPTGAGEGEQGLRAVTEDGGSAGASARLWRLLTVSLRGFCRG